MKNKTKTYLLLAFVLAVWGIIGFKMFSTLNPDVPDTMLQNKIVAFNPKANTELDTFSIQTTKRDPFLGTLYVKKKLKVKSKKVQPKEALVWPPIVYHGIVSKKQGKAQIFIISVNGQQHLVKAGQQLADIKLLKADTKSILVAYKGEKKTIAKI